MKREIVAVAVSLALLSSLGAPMVSAEPKVNEGLVEVVAPSYPTLINGIPEEEVVTPFATIGPFFVDYFYSGVPSRAEKFREIVYFTHDNRGNSVPYNMSSTITHSSSVGSEWNGSVSFTAEIKFGIFTKLGGTGSVGYKENRTENEAVGVSGSMSVPPWKQGKITFYYAARATAGTLRVGTYYDYSDTTVYTDIPINAKIHPTILDVHSVAEVY